MSTQHKLLAGFGFLVFAVLFVRTVASHQPEHESVNPKVKIAEPSPSMRWLAQKALECQGDFNKLSRQDQMKVQAESHNSGPQAMKSLYEQQKS